jgi:hypothetical protein
MKENVYEVDEMEVLAQRCHWFASVHLYHGTSDNIMRKYCSDTVWIYDTT